MKRGTRFLWPLVAGLVAFAQVADYVHLAVVRHALCAEHGELVEAGAPPASPGLAERVEATGPRFNQGAQAVEVGDHHHCLATLATQQQARLAAPIQVASTTWAGIGCSLDPRAVRAPALPQIRLAPKQSPPALS
jgi:hypothetical protein